MLKIALVDDDSVFQEQLKDYIERFFDHKNSDFSVHCYRDGVDFLSEYRGDPDIVIIDIMMPFMNGLEVARKLRERDRNVLVLFITATADFAIRGYEVSAVDYILKPLSYETDFHYKFARVVQKAEERRRRKKELVLKDDNGGFVRLNVDDLVYVNKDRDDAVYHTRKGTYARRGSMSQVRESLQGEMAFAMANSGCLVNMAYVDNIQGNLLVMSDGAQLLLSRGKKKEFVERFFDYMDR